MFLGGPFSKPVVLLADYREARDIETRRTHEFERSARTKAVFGPLGPTFQFVLPSGSEWKARRTLVQDTVSRQFLEVVAVPTLYNSITNLISLWDKKILLSGGRPFSAIDDMFNATFDAVLTFSFGPEFPHSAMQPQVEMMEKYRVPDSHKSASVDVPMEFPTAKLDTELESMQTLISLAEGAINSGWQKGHWFFQTRSAKFKAAKKSKDACIKAAVHRAAQKRIKHLQLKEASDKSWIDGSVGHTIDRESKIAAKEGRQPDFFSEMIIDEVRYYYLPNAAMMKVYS